MEVIDSLQVHQSEEVPTRKIAAFSYFYDRAVDAGMIEQGASAVVQVRYSSLLLSSTLSLPVLVICGPLDSSILQRSEDTFFTGGRDQGEGLSSEKEPQIILF
jgi:hypothetical protein